MAPGTETRMYHKEVRKLLEAMNMLSVIACGNELMSGHSCECMNFLLKSITWAEDMAQLLKVRLTTKNIKSITYYIQMIY